MNTQKAKWIHSNPKPWGFHFIHFLKKKKKKKKGTIHPKMKHTHLPVGWYFHVVECHQIPLYSWEGRHLYSGYIQTVQLLLINLDGVIALQGIDFGVCCSFNSCQVLIHCWSSYCMFHPSVPLHAGERLAQLVFRSENSASLWSLKAIHAMCEVEQSRVRSDPLSTPSHLCSFTFRFISSSL